VHTGRLSAEGFDLDAFAKPATDILGGSNKLRARFLPMLASTERARERLPVRERHVSGIYFAHLEGETGL
jgi:hypothetical protein